MHWKDIPLFIPVDAVDAVPRNLLLMAMVEIKISPKISRPSDETHLDISAR
jgi:hypothetical protein